MKISLIVSVASFGIALFAAGCGAPPPSPAAGTQEDLANKGSTAEALSNNGVCPACRPPPPQCQTYPANATVNVPSYLQYGDLGVTFFEPFTTCGFLTDFTNMNNQIPNGQDQIGEFYLSLNSPLDQGSCLGNQYFIAGWGNVNGAWTSLGSEELVGVWTGTSCELRAAAPSFLDGFDFTAYQTVRLGVTLRTNDGTYEENAQIHFMTGNNPG